MIDLAVVVRKDVESLKQYLTSVTCYSVIKLRIKLLRLGLLITRYRPIKRGTYPERSGFGSK